MEWRARVGKETVLFKTEEKMSRSDAVELLHRLAEKIDGGKVILRQADKNVKLKIPSRVEVEIKAEKEVGRKKTKKKIEIEIEWLVGAAANKGTFTLG